MKLFSFKPEMHVNIYFHNIKLPVNGKCSLFLPTEITQVSQNCWKKSLHVIFQSDIPIVPHYLFYFATHGFKLWFSTTSVKFTHHLSLILIYWCFLIAKSQNFLKSKSKCRKAECIPSHLFISFSLDIYKCVLKHLCWAYIAENVKFNQLWILWVKKKSA